MLFDRMRKHLCDMSFRAKGGISPRNVASFTNPRKSRAGFLASLGMASFIKGFQQSGKPVCAVLFLALGISFAAGADAPTPTYDSIASKVMCVCGGCVAPLSQCPHIDCGTKAEMQAYVKQEIAAGKSEATILQDFSARYGVSVLTAPPAKGFNLTVWTLPGIGLFVGLAGVIVIVRRWRRRAAPEAAVPVAPIDPQTLAAVEEEMKSAKLG